MRASVTNNETISRLKRPFLTIAIPTFNRAHLIKESLTQLITTVDKSISSINENIEILVVDNCSSDETTNVISIIQESCPYLRYIRNKVNLGIDKNIQKCVLNSHGQYVHLLSDDDIVRDNLYKDLVPFLRLALPDYLHLNVTRGDNMGIALHNTPVIEIRSTKLFDSYDKDKFLRLVNIWMTFISSFVFNREKWIQIDNQDNFIGTDIYLTHIALRIISKSNKICISAKSYIIVRDNFSGSYRIVKAFAIEWLKLVRSLPSLGYNRQTIQIVEKITLHKYLPYYINLAKVHPGCLTIKDKLNLFLSLARYPFAWRVLFPLAYLPAKTE